MAKGLRFSPPLRPPSPAETWALDRAFGPPASSPIALSAEDSEAAVAAARRLDLDLRIAARRPPAALAAEVGAAAAAALLSARTRAVAAALAIEAAAHEAAEVAAAAGVPVALLKFVALAAWGCVLPGSRRAGDVDLLASPERAEDLQRALLARGYRAAGLPGHEHQLPALVSPAGVAVEVHRMVLGVRPAGRRSATLEELERRGDLVPAPGFPAGSHLPSPAILAAHALVHGLVQHGHLPETYPLLRMVADLADLAAAGPPDLERRAAALAVPAVAPVEAAAVFGLARRLAAGDLAALVADPAAPAAVLLAHVLAGAADPAYRESLKLRLLAPPLTDRGPWAARAAVLAGALWLTRTQIDAIYGRPRSPAGYLLRRLARPFDLARRLARAWASARGPR